MTAKMTITPSQVDARIVETGKFVGGSLNVGTPTHDQMLGHVLNRLIDAGVTTLEIRVESTDD